MDRGLVYPGSIPLDTDVLNIQQRTMVAFGALLAATFGSSTLVDGLQCAPTNPASMSVVVSPGSIISSQALEAQPYGSLPADTSDALMKQGINVGSTTFALTAPATAGQSINYLIEAAFQETDSDPVVLPYYNSSNASQPYSGPGNSGVPQNTRRKQLVALELKAGAPATAGSQVTPAVDVGYVGLWVITVNYGMVTITASAISVYPGAPFISAKLGGLAMRRRLNGNLVVNVATNGDDAAAALSGGASSFKTIQAAVNFLYNNIDLNGYATAIGVGPGVFNESVQIAGTMTGAPPGYALAINGAGASSTTIAALQGDAFTLTGGAQVIIGSLKVTATSTNPNQPYLAQGHGLVAKGGALIGINQGVEFGTCDSAHLYTEAGGGIVTSGNPYTISGGAQYHSATAAGGKTTVVNSAVTLTGTPAFSVAYAYVLDSGTFETYGCTFTGTATGPRYLVATNGVINTNGASVNFLPGSASGSQSTGGQYV